MTIWIIEPRDPLIVRDGRPFGPDPGARAATLPFPFPSTIAGGLRHKAGLRGDGTFDQERIAAVLHVGVAGPLLVELEERSEHRDHIRTWFMPAPADVVLVRPDVRPDTLILKRLLPLALPQDAVTNGPADLNPVGLSTPIDGKADETAPRFWRWHAFARWLLDPRDGEPVPNDLGIAGLETNTRTHVSIRPQTQTAEEGLLFQTRGLEFTGHERAAENGGIVGARRLALATWCASPSFDHFSGGLAPLGGERRLMRWSRLEEALPALPETLSQTIATARGCRVLLLTPALFRAGYRPTRLLEPQPGVTPQLIGAAVPRLHVVSGWDMAGENGPHRPKGKPKPTRRLVAAGAVYFLRFAEDDDPDAIAHWVTDHWMRCISDDEHDQRDGFGLAMLGVGPREPVTMEVRHDA